MRISGRRGDDVRLMCEGSEVSGRIPEALKNSGVFEFGENTKTSK